VIERKVTFGNSVLAVAGPPGSACCVADGNSGYEAYYFRAADLAPVVKELQAAGFESL
jgi:hypothetical protein